MAGNMESMLLGDSSDEETNNSNTGVPQPLPAAPPDYSARLKSLYSNNSKPNNQPLQQPATMPMQQHQQQHMPPSMPASRSSSMTVPPAVAAPDPFEPTPLTNIIQRHSSSSARSSAQPMSQQPMLNANPTPIPTHASLPSHTQSSSSRYNPAPGPHRTAVPSSSVNYSSNTMQPRHSISSSSSQYQQHQQQQQHHQQQQQRSSVTSSRQQATPAQIAAAKKAKDQFLMFTRVLMKYLESKDAQMHARAKNVIRECAEKNKKKEQGYESVTASMKKRLRQTVGEQYWKRAESYLLHFVEMRRKKQQQQGSSSSASAPSSATHQQKQMLLQQQKLQQKKLQEEKLRQQKLQQQKQQEQQKALMEQQKKREMEKRKIQKQKEEIMRKQNAEKMRQQKLQYSRENKEQAAKAARSATKSDSAKRRVSGTKRSSTPVTSVTTVPAEVIDETPREYSELMEMVDHAVDYDWTSAPNLLADKDTVDLDEEQKALLYGESRPKISTDHKLRRGWSERNVVSTRTAWATVRLPELDRDQASSAMRCRWLNEERAEEDRTLALLSEASQIYIKDILSKALECARQRENLDGIRLWHMQHQRNSEDEPPPMGLRLGCDVSRQIALAEENAALTVKRMKITK